MKMVREKTLLVGKVDVHSLSGLHVANNRSIATEESQRRSERRKRSQCAWLFSVFDVKQVFVSNNKMYAKLHEDAFVWPWLVDQI